MQETSNLKLKKPEYHEAADIMILNDNFDLLDTAVNERAILQIKEDGLKHKLKGLTFVVGATEFIDPANIKVSPNMGIKL